MSFAKRFVDKYGKKLMDTAKTASKRTVQKTSEVTGDLIRNKIANKITSVGKWKEKEKTKKVEEIYIPPEKRQQIIDYFKLFWALNLMSLYKNEISKNFKFARYYFWW